jgi:hypothetical protein
MSDTPSLLSLRFRGGEGQERGTGACGKLNLNPIPLVDGCCNGSCGAEPQQRLWMQFDLAAGRNSVASDAETTVCGCSGCGPLSSAAVEIACGTVTGAVLSPVRA